MSSTLTTPVVEALTPSYAVPAEPRRNRVAVVGLVVAIAGLVVALIPFAAFFAWFLALPALVLGIVGAARKGLPHKAAAWAIALACTGWVVSIAMSVVTFAAFGTIDVRAAA